MQCTQIIHCPHHLLIPSCSCSLQHHRSASSSNNNNSNSSKRVHLTPEERKQCSSLRQTAMSASLYDSMSTRYAFKKSTENISLMGAFYLRIYFLLFSAFHRWVYFKPYSSRQEFSIFHFSRSAGSYFVFWCCLCRLKRR